MAGNEDCDILFAVEPQEELADLDDALRVEAVDGLVEHQKVGAAHQRQGDAEALAHAERKVAHLLFSYPFQTDVFEHGRDMRPVGNAERQTVLGQIFRRRHLAEEGGRFDHRPYAAAGAADVSVFILLSEQGKAAARLVDQAADKAHQRGLTCAVPAHKAVYLPAGDVHGHIVDDVDVFISFHQ